MIELTEHAFYQEVILVIIPTVAGVLTSKWVSSSWQKRKEKSEMVLKVLNQFDEIFSEYVSFINIAVSNRKRQLQRTLETLKKMVNTPNTEERSKLIGKDNDSDAKELEKDMTQFAKFNDGLGQIWKFESNLRVYYKGKNLVPELHQLVALITDLINYHTDVTDLMPKIADAQAKSLLAKKKDNVDNMEDLPKHSMTDFDALEKNFHEKMEAFIQKSEKFRSKLMKIKLAT